MLAPNNARERIVVDSDLVIELDMSVPMFRYVYYHYDIDSSLEATLIRRLVSPSDTFVDVGAHVGYFTLIAGKYARQVYAFEPSPATYAYLRRNLELNPSVQSKITAYQKGLSDRAGQLLLHRPASQPDMASLQPTDMPDTITETVEIDTLDHALPSAQISFLKVDVEGAEFGVLNGGRDRIAASSPIILCELFESFQQRFGHTCDDIVHLLESHGYEAYQVEESDSLRGRVAVHRLDLAQLSATRVNTGLFVPASRNETVLHQLGH